MRPATPTPRLLVVADDPLSASALRSALRAARAFLVLDGYGDGRACCMDAVTEQEPDVVIVDQLRSPARTLDRIGDARRALGAGKVIALATRMDATWVAALTGAGADAAVLKMHPLETLSRIVGDIVAGRVFHTVRPPSARLRPAGSVEVHALTERELEILRLVAVGAPNGRIAAQLWITEQTVKFHLSNVFRKLGVTNRTEASLHAYTHGLLEDLPGAEIAA
jgi:DNA-binding NarL/FixJ family response regulator